MGVTVTPYRALALGLILSPIFGVIAISLGATCGFATIGNLLL